MRWASVSVFPFNKISVNIAFIFLKTCRHLHTSPQSCDTVNAGCPAPHPAPPAIIPLRNWMATGKNSTGGCTYWHKCQKDVSLFGPDSDISGPASLWVGAGIFPDKLHKFKCKTSQGMTLGVAFCVFNEKWGLSCLPKGTHLAFGGVFLSPQFPVSPSAGLLGAYPTTLGFSWKWPVSAFF